MGVSWVLEVKENARSVELAFEQAGAIYNDNFRNFKVDCTWYQPVKNQISSFYVLHHTHYPDSSFVIGTGAEQEVSRQARGTTDRGFDLILGKLNAGLSPELSSRCELNGTEYRLRDFRLRVGTVSMGTAVKGVVVEVEYAASNIVNQCLNLIQETIDLFFPGYANVPDMRPEVLSLQSANADNYFPMDTMAQYLNVFLAMRAN